MTGLTYKAVEFVNDVEGGKEAVSAANFEVNTHASLERWVYFGEELL